MQNVNHPHFWIHLVNNVNYVMLIHIVKHVKLIN